MKEYFDKLKPLLNDVLKYTSDNPQMLSLVALFLAFVALLLAVRRREVNIGKLQQVVQENRLILEELRGKFARDLDVLRARLQTLEGGERLELESSAPELAQEKKKEKVEFSGFFEDDSGEVSLNKGLAKSRLQLFSKIKNLLAGDTREKESIRAALEEMLISSDFGVAASERLLSRLSFEEKDLSEEKLREELKSGLLEILQANSGPELWPLPAANKPYVILVVGINGVGKTTSIAKIANLYREKGAKVLLAACDTFRAAAVEQLATWASRIGVEIVKGDENAKPATIAYTAVEKAKNENYDLLIIDSAGRLHTKVNLMSEIEKLQKTISRVHEPAPQEIFLVLDATTGQNALQQARQFHQKLGLSGLVLSKLDGTPKGGMLVGISEELGVPTRYLGVGEGLRDLKVFSAAEFVDGLFADLEPAGEAAEPERDEPQAFAEAPRARRGQRRG